MVKNETQKSTSANILGWGVASSFSFRRRKRRRNREMIIPRLCLSGASRCRHRSIKGDRRDRFTRLFSARSAGHTDGRSNWRQRSCGFVAGASPPMAILSPLRSSQSVVVMSVCSCLSRTAPHETLQTPPLMSQQGIMWHAVGRISLNRQGRILHRTWNIGRTDDYSWSTNPTS
jgi:hypothetical protein